MTDRPPRGTNPGRPSRIDTSTAHSARIYNYWLGGKDNFPADREAFCKLLPQATLRKMLTDLEQRPAGSK